MYIIIILVMLLIGILFARFLVPILMIVAGIALFSNIRSLVARKRPTDYESSSESKSSRTIEYTDQDNSSPFRRTEEVEAPDIMLQRPASVLDDEFWEKDHTVYDVAYEDTELDESDEDLN